VSSLGVLTTSGEEDGYLPFFVKRQRKKEAYLLFRAVSNTRPLSLPLLMVVPEGNSRISRSSFWTEEECKHPPSTISKRRREKTPFLRLYLSEGK